MGGAVITCSNIARNLIIFQIRLKKQDNFDMILSSDSVLS